MPWKETCTVDERMKLVAAYLAGELPMTEVSRGYGISRKTAYKWVKRYEAEGPEGLLDRSRAPRHHPQAISEATVAVILEARRAHPRWGPRKLLAWLARRNPLLSLPAASTVGDLLSRYGLTRPRKRRRRVPPYTQPFKDCNEPNAVWCVDFKGDFRTGEGRKCYPLTLTDAYSRYLLRCQALDGTATDGARPILVSAFREFGLPLVIRSDNGSPFATRGPHGLSKLSIWWLKLGIRHERIKPGHPEQNGRHERMHRTLKDETAKPPRATRAAQQRAFNRFKREFNDDRPHEALGQQTPASWYEPSCRPYPRRIPQFSYPNDCSLRTVHGSGRVRWRGHLIHVGAALAGEEIALAETAEDVWHVYFGPLTLGVLDLTRIALGLIRVDS